MSAPTAEQLSSLFEKAKTSLRWAKLDYDWFLECRKGGGHDPPATNAQHFVAALAAFEESTGADVVQRITSEKAKA